MIWPFKPRPKRDLAVMPIMDGSRVDGRTSIKTTSFAVTEAFGDSGFKILGTYPTRLAAEQAMELLR